MNYYIKELGFFCLAFKQKGKPVKKSLIGYCCISFLLIVIIPNWVSYINLLVLFFITIILFKFMYNKIIRENGDIVVGCNDCKPIKSEIKKIRTIYFINFYI